MLIARRECEIQLYLAQERPRKKPLAEAMGAMTKASLLATFLDRHIRNGQDVIEEVIVTAQKRTDHYSPCQLALQRWQRELETLTSTTSEITFSLPSVSFASRRPGQANLFMRGISEGGNGNQCCRPFRGCVLKRTAGHGHRLQPRPPHVRYTANRGLKRTPRHTLWGSISGREFKNNYKPTGSRRKYSAGFDISAETISTEARLHGGGLRDIPLSDDAAVRIVGYTDSDGGYIDAVSDSITYPIGGITRDNAGFTKNDFNESDKSGLRAALGIDLNDSWTATAAAMYQETEADGIWDHDPETWRNEGQPFFR